MKQLILKVNPKDNVLVALQNLSKGDSISFEQNNAFSCCEMKMFPRLERFDI